jgi:hypothetical protein
MTATNHALTGALLAVTIKEPILAITAAFASHFILDILPHFGIKREIEYLKKSWLMRFVVLFEVVAMTFLIFYLPSNLNHITGGFIVLACMFVAVAPDFMWTYRYARRFLGNGSHVFKSTFMHYHEKIQTYEKPAGLVIEAAWLATFLPAILHLVRR